MDLADEFVRSREFHDFADACEHLYNRVTCTSVPLSDWSTAYTLFRKQYTQHTHAQKQPQKQLQNQLQKQPKTEIVTNLSVKTKLHTPHTTPHPSDTRTDKLFRTSKPYTHACRRCEKKIEVLERRIEAVSEELEVHTQAEDNAHREQIQARVNVTMTQAINSVAKKDASSLKPVSVTSLSQTINLASGWTDVLKELRKGRRLCVAQHRRLHDDLNILEQEAEFLMHAAPQTFLAYLRDQDGDDEDEVYTHGSVAFTISDEAKTSVLEAAAAVDREHHRNARLHSSSSDHSNSDNQKTRQKTRTRPYPDSSLSPISSSSSSDFDNETPRPKSRSRLVS
jgi:hypothetical protein